MSRKYRIRSLKVFLWKWCFWQFRNIHKKAYISESFIKKTSRLIKNKLRQSCFPMNCVNCFKNTYFEGPLQVAVNNTTICFVKIHHLLRQGSEKITVGVFVSFHRIFSNESNLPTPFVFSWPALTNQISNHLRLNYEFSLHLRAEALVKKLTCIHVQLAQLVEFVKRWSIVSEKFVSFDSRIT